MKCQILFSGKKKVKALITPRTDNNNILFFYFSEKIRLDMSCEMFCLADDSHEMSGLIFSEK